jgi:hypothetical protein
MVVLGIPPEVADHITSINLNGPLLPPTCTQMPSYPINEEMAIAKKLLGPNLGGLITRNYSDEYCELPDKHYIRGVPLDLDEFDERAFERMSDGTS